MPHVELPQAEFKVVLLGDSNAGKTSLVLRFAEGYYRDAPRSSTVGAFFITKRIQTSTGITCKIQIWDTAGQSQFRPMAPMYYRNAAAAIVCYDVTSAQSYKVMRDWLDELHRNVPAGSIVIAIASTKCDLTDTMRPAVPVSEAEDLAQALGAIFVDTSAKDNYGVTALFQRVAERVLRFQENGKELPITPGASVNEKGAIMNGDVPHESEDNPYIPNMHLDNYNEINDNEREDFNDARHNARDKSSSKSRKDNDSDKNAEISIDSPVGKGATICDGAPLACGIFSWM